jgi:ABC-type antimicrobial peptide transport system permease subunit
MALGATPGSLLRLVLRQAVGLVAVGLGIGVCGALLSGQALRTLLFGVTPTDAITYVIVSIAFVAVSVVACALPARRAAAVDPVEVFRGA